MHRKMYWAKACDAYLIISSYLYSIHRIQRRHCTAAAWVTATIDGHFHPGISCSDSSTCNDRGALAEVARCRISSPFTAIGGRSTANRCGYLVHALRPAL